MKAGMIVGIVVAVVAIGGGFYAWQSGLLNYQVAQSQEPTRETQGQSAEPAETPAETVFVQNKTTSAGEKSAAEKIQEYREKPTLCASDSECKIIPITCNKCDCGRAVNVYIEPYACTEADKANPCNLSCPPSRAVCDNGVCKKVGG